MLLIPFLIQISGIIIAGDEENPEIEDISEDDIFGYVDILSAWIL